MHPNKPSTTSATDNDPTWSSEEELEEEIERSSATLDAVLIGLAIVTLVAVIVVAAMR